MISLTPRALAFLLPAVAYAYTPISYRASTGPEIDGLQEYKGDSITLDSSNPVLTLDYGAEVAGYPYIQTDTPEQPVQVELKYTEPFEGLGLAQGDGPW